jgi:RNA recognition motif-containing protein
MVSKLFVGGLPFSTTSESLRRHFAQSGTVVSAEVVTDRFSGEPRGFGFVEMSTDTEAKAAINLLNGQMFEGRRLRVELAMSSGSRSGGSRSGGFGGGKVRTSRW